MWRAPILEARRVTWADAVPFTSDNAFAEFVDVALDGRIFISSDRSGNQDLFVLGNGESELRQLTFDSSLQAGPRVSPDGNEIVFYAFSEGSRDVMVMPADGGPARTLAPHPSEDITPAWTPDGSQIVFASRRSGNRDIWIVDAAGGDPKQLTVSTGGELAPVSSPDGQWIYFAREGIWRIPAAGGEPERVTQSGFPGRFSPDGKMLYFADRRTDNVWAKTLEDGSERPLSDLAGRPGALGWDIGADGANLYFTWMEELGDIWVMDVEYSK